MSAKPATGAGHAPMMRNSLHVPTPPDACWVREFLAGFGPKDLVVQPVIVVPGWYVESKGNYPVKAMNAKYLVGYLKGYLKGAKRVLSPEELETTMRRLDERCRVVEF